MSRHLIFRILVVGLLAAGSLLNATAADNKLRASYSKYKEWSELEAALIEKAILRQQIPMRDGVKLDAEIYLPNTAAAPYPTVLIRSPYPAKMVLQPREPLVTLVESGYAIVYEYERGRYWSEGEYEFLANAGNDGYDTVDWISRQEWSNGRIGTFGCSSLGENQLRLSVAAHPAHKAAIALGHSAGVGEIGPYAEQGSTYRGGAIHLFVASWYHDYAFYGKHGDPRPTFPSGLSRDDRVRLSRFWDLSPDYTAPNPNFDYRRYLKYLPISEMNMAVGGLKTDWERFSRRTPGDPAWSEIAFANEGHRFGVPMLWGFSWYDIAVAPGVAMYNYAREHTSTPRAQGAQQMIVGPMPHCAFGYESKRTVVGERDLGDARFDYVERYLEWFDYWLKGTENGALQRPAVQYYQMGANEWVTSDQFPKKGTKYVDLYLDSQGAANSLYGDGMLRYQPPMKESSDSFIYDPLRPVPTLGGGTCCMGESIRAGSFDQSSTEIRNDVLVYTTSELKEDVTMAGFIEMELYVSSDAKDSDFTVKLLDVYPDGRSYNLDDTIFRARYREGWKREVFMKPGDVYKLTIPPMISANTFKKGHRIRIEVSSSNFPHYERNLNTGGNNYDESNPVVARNRIHHSPKYPSRIRLPVSGAGTLADNQ